jgi:predicted transcriptional regulator
MVAAHELGPLEMQVLGLLDPDEPLPVASIQARLASAGAELAYTTVMTVLVRLLKKGLVVRKKEGNRFLYAASGRSPGVSEGILTRIHRTLFQGDRTRPILALLDDEALSADDLRALRRVIDERLKGGGR